MHEFKKIAIEAVSEDSIQYDNTWISVTGKAKEFLSGLTAGDYVTIGIENGSVAYVKKLGVNPKEEKPQETNVGNTTNTSDSPSKRTMSPNEFRGLQAQIGGLTHDAVQIAISKDNLTKECIKSNIKMLKEIQDDLCQEYKEEFK